MSETFQSENIHEISYEQDVFQNTSISLFIAAFIEICIFRQIFIFNKKKSFNERLLYFYKVHATFNNLQ